MPGSLNKDNLQQLLICNSWSGVIIGEPLQYSVTRYRKHFPALSIISSFLTHGT